MDKSWEERKEYLPEVCESKSKELGALTRRREIKTADELLALKPVACERRRLISSDIVTDEADGRDKP